MKSQGIRILDKNNRIVSVELPDILKEIQNGDLFHWSILFLEATGHLGEGRSIPIFEKQIYDSEKGLFITWNELNLLSGKFHQVIDIILIGCKDKNLLRRYDNDQEMYETCDIVIEMFDSCYWEVFSKDKDLINRLAAKFKDIKFLAPDFEK
ncbi:MAG: hypothetical protein HZB76_03975 [Chlamydiae bacterium]|nr:hypothetical protein [Chlamydiota bacterium]